MIRFNEDAVLKHFNPGEITDINFNTTEKKKKKQTQVHRNIESPISVALPIA